MTQTIYGYTYSIVFFFHFFVNNFLYKGGTIWILPWLKEEINGNFCMTHCNRKNRYTVDINKIAKIICFALLISRCFFLNTSHITVLFLLQTHHPLSSVFHCIFFQWTAFTNVIFVLCNTRMDYSQFFCAWPRAPALLLSTFIIFFFTHTTTNSESNINDNICEGKNVKRSNNPKRKLMELTKYAIDHQVHLTNYFLVFGHSVEFFFFNYYYYYL